MHLKKRAKWFFYLKMGNQQQRMTEQPRKTDKINTQYPETDGVDSSLTLPVFLYCQPTSGSCQSQV